MHENTAYTQLRTDELCGCRPFKHWMFFGEMRRSCCSIDTIWGTDKGASLLTCFVLHIAWSLRALFTQMLVPHLTLLFVRRLAIALLHFQILLPFVNIHVISTFILLWPLFFRNCVMFAMD